MGGSVKYAEWLRYTLGFMVRAADELPASAGEAEAVLATYTGRSPRSRASVVRAMRVFFGWAARRYGVPNAMDGVGRVIVKGRVVRRTLCAADVERVLWSSARDRRADAVLRLLLDTGARIGEVYALTWRSFEGDGVEGYRVKLDGKTGERVVPVSAETMAALRPLLDREPMWISRCGSPLTLNGLQRVVRAALARGGVAGGPHLLRHTFGRQYIKNGGSVFGLKKMLGHEQIGTTEMYVYLDDADVAEEHARCSPLSRVAGGRQLKLMEVS
jgi:integrase